MALDSPTGDYLDFELSIWAQGNRYYARVTDSPAGPSESVALASFFENREKVETLLLRVENAMLRGNGRVRGPLSIEEKTLQEFGHSVFDIVFRQAQPIALNYAQSQEKAAKLKASGLRLSLRIQEPEVAQLPWEYLYDTAEREWLGLAYRSPIIRYLDGARADQPLLVEGPLNILAMIANPGGDWDPIDAERERRILDQAIGPHQKAGRINFCWVPGETEEDLLKAINKGSWHVFHFIGHGGLWKPQPGDTAAPEGFIVLSDGLGGAREVRASTLKVRLSSRTGSLRLVVLNCCEGARGTADNGRASPAATLVRAGIAAVVAMQFPISDPAAVQLAGGFYDKLADGWPLEAALTFARQMIQVKSPTEWGIPALFTRAKTGQLFGGLRPLAPDAPTPVDSDTAQARARLRELFRV
jgi:hypothetical protein